MTSTTQTPRYEIGSREWKYANFARSLRFHADSVDNFADAVEAWGWDPKAETALGLIEAGESFTKDAERFYADPLMGPRTKSSFLNDASIALGASNGAARRGRGTIAYACMYALTEVERVEDGRYNRVELRQSRTAVKRSSLRVHASSCRVIAGIAEDVAAGKYLSIG